MKEELRKHWILYLVLYVLLVGVMVFGLWISIPIYPNPYPEVESEDKLIKKLKNDIPDIVYADFLEETYGLENVRYQIRVRKRTRFGAVSGYSVGGEILIGDKSCHISVDGYAGGEIKSAYNFQYRDIEGCASLISNQQKFGVIDVLFEEYKYSVSYSSGVTLDEGEISTLNEYAFEIVYRVIDMALDGETIGK